MLLTQADDVGLAHHGLAAGVDVHVNAHFLALADDVVALIVGQVELVAVLRRPAAGAVQVAGGGRVQEDGPGDVAAVFFAVLLLNGPAHQVDVDKEVDGHGGEHIVIHIIDHVTDVGIVGVVGVLDGPADGGALGLKIALAELVGPVHQRAQILLRVLVEVTEGLLQSHFLDRG